MNINIMIMIERTTQNKVAENDFVGLWHARLLTWKRSIWFECISESRRPRFEPDIDNVTIVNGICLIEYAY